MAGAFAVASIPLFIVGARRDVAWLPYQGGLTIAAGTRGATLGWTAATF